MTEPAFTMDPEHVAKRLDELGAEWADAHAAACLLEETEKSMLAEITAMYRPNSKSQTEAESCARASNEYRSHIAEMVEARRKANRARVRFDSMKVWVELKRSQCATERAAMTMR